MQVPIVEIETPHGPARAHVHSTHEPRGMLVLGHGADGGVTARDLVAVTEVALEESVGVVLVEQPYRVAGRRSPAPAHQLDTAWVAVIEHLRGQVLDPSTLIVGGRSSGARVACRTATAVGAAGVLCLAFPLQPPRRSASGPRPSRIDELDDVRAPTLVIQGVRDPFGMPPTGAQRTVVEVQGDHSLRTDAAAIGDAVRGWLAGIVERA